MYSEKAKKNNCRAYRVLIFSFPLSLSSGKIFVKHFRRDFPKKSPYLVYTAGAVPTRCGEFFHLSLILGPDIPVHADEIHKEKENEKDSKTNDFNKQHPAQRILLSGAVNKSTVPGI